MNRLTPATLPGPKSEAYKYTPLARLLKNRALSGPMRAPVILTGVATILATDDMITVTVPPDQIVTVIDQADHIDASQWQSRAIFFDVGLGATVTYLRLNAGTGAMTDQVTAYLARAARFDMIEVQLGAVLARTDFSAHLNDTEASVNLWAVQALATGAHADLNVTVYHHAPHTFSSQHIRAVVATQATGVFQGKIHVAPGAHGTEANQQAKAILLAPTAVMNIKPELEIYADDVVCAHGASTGPLDPEQMFYATARGLTPDQARQLLTSGFLWAILPDVPGALIAPLEEMMARTGGRV